MTNTDPIKFHQELIGKTRVASKVILDETTLPIAYTPGVGVVSEAIAADHERSWELTGRGNRVAIVTDGSAVLGLGNIGPEAAMPVMEGKAAIFSQFAGVNASSICLATQDVEEIIKTVKYLEPSFGGINLEDISAPRCFEIERRLELELDIPVFHDDQHGTAIVVLAGLINAIKVVGKNKSVRIVISGAGAAGIAIAELLASYGFTNYCMCDSKGTISEDRNDLNSYKKEALERSTQTCTSGSCEDSLVGADVIIGVSQPEQFTAENVKKMAKGAIVFALANPVPEIMPEEAARGGAAIIATGRSDFPNQLNNALVFPGLFRGLLDNKIRHVTNDIKVTVAEAIASLVEDPNKDNIIPSIFDKRVASTIADALKQFSE